MKDTISASCSIAPDSLRSESIGLFPGLVSTVLESWESAITGTFNSFAMAFNDLEIIAISCSRFPPPFPELAVIS